jgi:hypothetical protein
MSGTERSAGELDRFAIDCALRDARVTELWIPADPDFGFVDYFEAAAARNLGLLHGFEYLGEDIDERGILPQSDSDQTQLVTDGGTEQPDAPWYCPWCEAVIVIDGEIVTGESDAYWHAYDHREKGPYAVTVMEAFEVLDTVETEQHKIEPAGGDA